MCTDCATVKTKISSGDTQALVEALVKQFPLSHKSHFLLFTLLPVCNGSGLSRKCHLSFPWEHMNSEKGSDMLFWVSGDRRLEEEDVRKAVGVQLIRV